MSLNGLDAVKVNQAHEAAGTEIGGWFLLKYITRDEIDVYKTGTGGSTELREAIGEYEDKSPLYGLLLYRRKRVLLKYVPEGTSRLLKARLAIHQQSVIEKFPHDALVSLERASELTDAALSSSVSALKASGSIRSMNSLKRRRLTEIVEDASEVPIDTPLDTLATEEAHQIIGDTPHTPEQEDSASTSTTKAVRELDENNDLDLPRQSIELPQVESRPSLALSERSIGSKSLHNNYSSNSDSHAYLFKPKVRLAPRPVIESRHSSPYVRPTSTLPAGIQLRSRNSAAMPPPPRPHTSGRSPNPSPPFTSTYTNGFSPPLTPSINDYRPSSRGSAATVPANVRYNNDDSLTPEKKRLMKALQKRKQQQKARQLAKEGRFEDAERQLNGKGTSPRRSISPRKLKKSALAQDTMVKSSSADDTPIIQLESNLNMGLRTELEPELDHRESTNRILAPLPGAPLSSDTADIGGEIVPDLKLRTQASTASNYSNLPQAQSMLQFPNWTETNDGVRRELPPSPPASDIHAATSADVASGSDVGSSVYVKRTAGVDNVKFFEENRNQGPTYDGSPVKETDTDPTKISGWTQISKTTMPLSDLGAGSSPLQINNAVHENVQHDLQLSIQPAMEKAVHQKPDSLQDSDTHVDSVSMASAVAVEMPKMDGEGAADAHIPDTTAASGALDMIHETHSHEDVADESATTMAADEVTDGADYDIEEPATRIQADGIQELKISTSSASGDRRIRPPPIQTPVRTSVRLSASGSKAPSLSEEDSLLDELEDAAVEEAKTVTLAKTPTTPFTPSIPRQVETRRSSEGSHKTPPSIAEVVPPTPAIPSNMANASPPSSQMSQPSSEIHSPMVTPDAAISVTRSSIRDISPSPYATPTPFGSLATRSRQGSLSPPGPELERPSSRRSAVSSLISQRMKAFEDKFASSSTPQQAPTSAVKAQIVTLRKVSLNSSPSSAAFQPASSRTTPIEAYTSAPSPSFGQRFGFGRARKDEVISKKENIPPLREKITEAATKLNQGVQDSPIKVIREADVSPSETKTKKSFFSSRKKKTASISSMASLKREERLSLETPQPTKSTRNSTSDPASRSRSPSSVESVGDGDKKEKRKSGILKRLSTMGSSHRTIAETMASPLNEDPAAEANVATTAQKWQASIVLGDLNVQYPDTLLWKRKYIEIDQQGLLILSPSLSEMNSKIATKRYHISEFRNLYIPEPDREELPHSVNLDFHDGSTIQCACESFPAQQRVHQALITARNAFNNS